MSRYTYEDRIFSRRSLIKGLGIAPLLLQSAPLRGSELLSGSLERFVDERRAFPLADVRLVPHYPAKSPLEDVLRLVAPGLDEFVTEKYAFEIESVLHQWREALERRESELSVLAQSLDPSLIASSLTPSRETKLRSRYGIDCIQRQFSGEGFPGRERFLGELRTWLGHGFQVETAEMQITAIEEIAQAPLAVRVDIRYDLVTRRDEEKHERVGVWHMEWSQDAGGLWKVRRWSADEETVAVVRGPVFVDVTAPALGGVDSYVGQMLRGTDHWRSVLDGACGIEVYGNNGVAAGDFDNDGFDDLYVCQPAGLPNRLYRNRGDGTLEDVTEKAGVGVLDSTACALFADFRNSGLQDLLVVCGGGPLLFANRGDGTFALQKDAFKFERPAEGSFTHAAVADYDSDGRLDVYFCLYSYYLGLDQYHYPVPYYDARNGPPNFLFHNDGDGTFTDRTAASGLSANNDRYSFACAWGHSDKSSPPDLYVANDFGRANLYRNHGDGTFTVASTAAGVDDAGAGMSAAWCDVNNDGRQDIYAANMWSAAGQRVAGQKQFHARAEEAIRALYRRHAGGNSLYRNEGGDKFQNVSQQSGVEMGRWSWCSDFWDFDHDGYPDLYVANGYISGPESGPAQKAAGSDLGSFFWRQVVAKSPEDTTPSPAYERGWNALNELIRSDGSWSGHERNVMFANNGNGTFTEVSGAVGLDFSEDGRSFVLADLDRDGRLEVIVKSRNAPQIRILHNVMKETGASIAFRLRGTRSNRDAIGAAIRIEAGELTQTKYLQAGSGFLAQHSKELSFGVGKTANEVKATVHWPSGLVQEFEKIPVNHRIELEEGSVHFMARPFSAPNPVWSQAATAVNVEPLPAVIATWLIEPLKAPEFSLPDLSGKVQALRTFRGKLTLLTFWATTAPVCDDLLKVLMRHQKLFAANELVVVAINVDAPADFAKARAYATERGLPFPVLFATEDAAGVYNIIYRYLFDRRRDLAIPTSFLLDRDGLIVKVYQGPFEPRLIVDDVKSIPSTAAERIQKALPWNGVRYQGTFQRNDFTYGVALFQHGYLDQAAESFQQVIAAKPENAEGYYNLGTLNLRRNDLKQARSNLEQTLKLRPNYPEAWNNLGMIAAQEGQADEAIRNFQQSLSLRPEYATALLNLGNVYRRQKSYAQAEDSLDKAAAMQPDDPETQYSLGMLYAQQGKMEQAAEHLQRAIALRADYPEALNNLAVLYVRNQEYAKAEELFMAGVRLAPNFDQSYLNLARLYVLRSDKEKARGILGELLKIQPGNTTAIRALGLLQ